MSGIKTFAGNRYAAGGKAGMNRGGGGGQAAFDRKGSAMPMASNAANNANARSGSVIGMPNIKTVGQNQMQQNRNVAPQARGGQGGGQGGGRNPAQRIERLQNRLENRGNKIRSLKDEVGALKKQPPSPPVNMPGVNQSQSNAIGAANQGVEAVQGGPGQFMFGEDGPMTQRTMYGQQGGQQGSQMQTREWPMGQRGYGQMGGYGQDMSYGSEMPVDYPGMMSGGGQGMYGQMGGYGQQMGGMYGQQGGYDQQMGQQMGNQQPPRQQQDPNYVPRYIGSSQAVDEARRAQFGAVPGDKGYVNRMVQYYKGQGFPVPDELLQHWKGEQSRAQGLMGVTPQNKKPGQKQTRPAARPAARPGVKPTNPRGNVETRPARPGAKKTRAAGARAGVGAAPTKSRGAAVRGGKRRAEGGVIPRPAKTARPGMKGGGLARKGVGMALKGGGLARKGVGMALKSGGMVRGSGCAQRGRGKAK